MLNVEQIYNENRRLAKTAQSRQKTFNDKGYYNQAYENLLNAYEMLDIGSNPFSVKKTMTIIELEKQNRMLKKFLSKPTFAQTKKQILSSVDTSKYTKSEKEELITEYFDIKEAENYGNMLADSYGSKFIGELFYINRQFGGTGKAGLYKALKKTWDKVTKKKKSSGRKVPKSEMLKELAKEIDNDIYKNALE